MKHSADKNGDLVISVSDPKRFEGPRHKGAVLGLAGAAVELFKKDELVKEGLIDPVTGLKNRKAFELHMAKVLESAQQGDVSFLFLDIDGLKRVNNISYPTGDRYKRTVAQAIAEDIKNEFRPYDDVFAYGPDEFIAVLHREYDDPTDSVSHPSEKIDLSKVAERVAVGVDHKIQGIDVLTGMERLGVSVGWSTFEPNDSLTDMISRADEMCTQNKAERYAAFEHLRAADPRLA